MLRTPALSAIGAYQRYISPRKGYGCAYRLAYGGTGCSGFAKHTISDFGLFVAVPMIMKRFAACKQAALALHSTSEDDDQPNQQSNRRWYDHCDYCGGCYCPRGKSSVADTSADCSPDCSPDCCSL